MHLFIYKFFWFILTLCFLKARIDFKFLFKAVQGVVIRKGWKTDIFIILNKIKIVIADFSINCLKRLHFSYDIFKYVIYYILYDEFVEKILISIK